MKPSYTAELLISLHPYCSDFFSILLLLNAANFPVGSTSPCNSDDERKPRFIEKGTVFVRFPRHSNFSEVTAVVWFLFLNLISSEDQKQTLFQDGCQWLRYCITELCSLPPALSFSLNDGVLTTLCLNPPSVCASCANEKKKCIQDNCCCFF